MCKDMLKGTYFGAKTKTFEDILFLTNTPYPGNEIRLISTKSSQENAYSQFRIRRIHILPHVVNMDDPNITMEEYIRFKEEKTKKREKVFNWETAKYGKIWYDEDVHGLRSIEIKFLAIAFNDRVSSEKTLSCEPMVSSLNDEIDFKISFDDSDDED
nr:hypothetical protein [Tanacetum cinerariifolium]